VEEVFEGGDFVGFGRDLDLAADEFGLGLQGAEQLEGLAVDFGGGAEAFPIDSQVGDAQIVEMGAEPGGHQVVQLVGIQALQDAADGALAGGQELPGFSAPGGAQAAELVLV
jgi:hypothetical protein